MSSVPTLPIGEPALPEGRRRTMFGLRRISGRSSLRRLALYGLTIPALLLQSGAVAGQSGPPGLSLVKTGPATVVEGATFTYTLTLTNNSNRSRQQLVVVDTLPALGSVLAVSPTPSSQSGRLVTWVVPSLAPGDPPQTFTVTYRAPAGPTTLVNKGTLVSAIPFLDQRRLSVVTTQVTRAPPPPPTDADLRITKSAPDTVGSEETFRYSLLVENLGPSVAEDVVIEDVLPAIGAFRGASGQWTRSGNRIRWQVPTLAAGASVRFTIDFQAPTGPRTLTNTATVSSRTPDRDPTNNRSMVDTEVEAPAPVIDVGVEKRGPAQVTPNQQFTYTLVVANRGVAPALGVAVSDQLPSSGTFVSASAGGDTLQSGVVAWPNIPTLDVGDSVVYEVVYRAPASGTFVNTAIVSAPGDTDSTNDTSQVETIVEDGTPPGADLELEKTGPAQTTLGGASPTYRIVVRNIGRVPAQNVVVTDQLPDPVRVQFDSASPTPATESATALTWDAVPVLAVGDSLIYSVTLTPLALQSYVNRAVVTTETFEADTTNNADEARTLVVDTIPPRVPSLSLTKESSQLEASVGDIVQFRLGVSAGGYDTVSVSDVLPVGFRLVPGSVRLNGQPIPDPSGAAGRHLDFGPIVLATLAGFDPLGVTSFSITYRVRIGPEATTGDGVNVAVVEATDPRTGQTQSVEDRARVRLGGPFTDEGIIVGTVFLNCGCDDWQTTGELGIPGVRVYLQDGTAAVTDSEGKYSFVGLRPRMWVVRVDRSTLPRGARMEPLTNRHGNDGQSAFVDLKKGALERADFAEGSGSDAVREDTESRRAGGEVLFAQPTDGPRQPSAPVRSFRPVLPDGLVDDRNANLPPRPGLVALADDGRLPERAGVGDSSGVWLVLPSAGYRADGASEVPFTVRHDQAGSAVVTLESTEGTWLLADADSVTPGVQVQLADGAEVRLRAPDQHAVARLRASLDGGHGHTTELTFAPRLSPLSAIGLIEGRIDFRSLTDGELGGGATRDSFEDRIRNFDFDNDEGDVFGGARASAFMSGEVGDGYEVTVRLDSEENPDARLFRDIQPDAFYPVNGDASVSQFGAQSTGRFFGQVRRGASALTYGDFVTAEPGYGSLGSRALGVYTRSLNGALQHFENERVSFDAFASRDRSRQVVDEIAARGVSGPYALSRNDGLINSERVEVVTRDRNQPGVVLQSTVLERFVDYTIEPFTGQLLFRRPVPSVDAELNPIAIRVTYEVEANGEEFWVFGGFGQVKAHERFEVGGGWVRDDDPAGRYDLASVNATVDLGRGTYLLGEFARSESVATGPSGTTTTLGDASRAELQHSSGRLSARVFFQEVQRGFLNPSVAFLNDRREFGARSTARLNERTQLFGEWLSTRNLVTGAERRGGRVAVDRAIGEWIRGRLGFRFSEETGVDPVPGSSDVVDAVNAVGARLTARLPFAPRGSIFGEFEQDVSDAEQRRAVLGGDFRLLGRTRLYGRHEFISSLSGPYGLSTDLERNTTVFGLSSDYLGGSTVFTEYRARDAFAGRETQAAVGLRNLWNVAPGVSVNTSLERVSPLNRGSGAATAVTGGVQFTQDSLWKATARAEYYSAEGVDHVLGSLGLARKVSRNVTFLGSTVFNTVLDGERAFERTRLGFAYRETERNRWNALGRYEHRYERAPDFDGLENKRSAHILSSHLNFQPDDDLILRAQWASKFASNRTESIETTDRAHLLGARGTFDLTNRLDLGVIGRALFADAHETVQFGIGGELGLLVADNLRLAAGYNAFGFRDRELSVEEYTDRGFYLQLGYKFDETLFGRDTPDRGRLDEGPCGCEALTDLVVHVEPLDTDDAFIGVFEVTTENVSAVAAEGVTITTTQTEGPRLSGNAGGSGEAGGSGGAGGADDAGGPGAPLLVRILPEGLAPGAVQVDTVRVSVCESGRTSVGAYAETTTPESDTTDNVATAARELEGQDCPGIPNMAVEIDGPSTVGREPAEFTITADNTVDSSFATGVELSIQTPNRLVRGGAWPGTVDTLGTVEGSDAPHVRTFTLACSDGFQGSFELVAHVSTTSSETHTSDNEDRHPITVACAATDVAAGVVAPATVQAGDTFSVGISAFVPGPGGAEEVTLAAALPNGLDVVSVRVAESGDPTDLSGEVIAASMDPGARWEAILDVTVPACADMHGRSLTFVATAGTSSDDTNAENDRATARTQVVDPCPMADIEVAVRALPSDTTDKVWFEITTRNVGDETAESVRLTARTSPDPSRGSSARISGVAGDPEPDGRLRLARQAGDSVVWDLVDLQPGAELVDSLRISVACADPLPEAMRYPLAAVATSSTPERETANNRDQSNGWLLPSPPPCDPTVGDTTDIRVDIDIDGRTVVMPGEVVQFSIVSENVSDTVAHAIGLTVRRPRGTEFLPFFGDLWRAPQTAGGLDPFIWEEPFPRLEAASGGSGTLGGSFDRMGSFLPQNGTAASLAHSTTDSLRLRAPSFASYPNSFWVVARNSTIDPERDDSNNVDSVRVTVVDPPDPWGDVEITFDSFFVEGCEVTLEMLTRNRGVVTARDVYRQLILPAGVRFVSGSAGVHRSDEGLEWEALPQLDTLESWSDRVTLHFDSPVDPLTLSARVSSATSDADPLNNQDAIVVIAQDTIAVGCCESTCTFSLSFWPPRIDCWWWWLPWALIGLGLWGLYRWRRYGDPFAPCFRIFTVFRTAQIRQTVAELRDPDNRTLDRLRYLHDRIGGQPCADWAVTVELLHAYRDVRAWSQIYLIVKTMPPALRKKPIVCRLYAFALNRDHQRDKAESELRTLLERQGPRASTLGGLGRILKDRWEELRATDAQGAPARRLLESAIERYLEGHEADPENPYPGVNALTLAEFLPELPDWRELILDKVKEAVQEWATEFDYWIHATQAEVAALERNQAGFETSLKKALDTRHVIWQVETTLRNLRLIQSAAVEKHVDVPDWLREAIDRLQRMVEDAVD